MATFKQTISRLSRLTVLGFQGPRGKQMKRFVVCQWIACAFLLFMWIKINGGMLQLLYHAGLADEQLGGQLGFHGCHKIRAYTFTLCFTVFTLYFCHCKIATILGTLENSITVRESYGL